MAVHLMRELEKLKKMVLSLAAMTEDNLRRAVKSVGTRDKALAEQAIETDHDVDRVEVEVEEECLKILALHQPVAHDLRFIVAILKINHDLERIDDLAVDIAERARALASTAPLQRDFDLQTLADRAQKMVSGALDALINHDGKLAQEVWLSDDQVDDLTGEILTKLEDEVKKSPERLRTILDLIYVTRTLERIADHATNIAKDVLYMTSGEIVRHRSREFRAKQSQESNPA